MIARGPAFSRIGRRRIGSLASRCAGAPDVNDRNSARELPASGIRDLVVDAERLRHLELRGVPDEGGCNLFARLRTDGQGVHPRKPEKDARAEEPTCRRCS